MMPEDVSHTACFGAENLHLRIESDSRMPLLLAQQQHGKIENDHCERVVKKAKHVDRMKAL